MRLSHIQRQIPVAAPTVDVQLNRKRLLHMTSYPLLLRSSPIMLNRIGDSFPFKQGSSKIRSVIRSSIILIGRGFKQ